MYLILLRQACAISAGVIGSDGLCSRVGNVPVTAQLMMVGFMITIRERVQKYSQVRVLSRTRVAELRSAPEDRSAGGGCPRRREK